jgi:hypothetical protein
MLRGARIGPGPGTETPPRRQVPAVGLNRVLGKPALELGIAEELIDPPVEVNEATLGSRG